MKATVEHECPVCKGIRRIKVSGPSGFVERFLRESQKGFNFPCANSVCVTSKYIGQSTIEHRDPKPD